MAADLALKGRLLDRAGNLVRGTLAVKDGRFVEPADAAGARRSLDFGDALLLPGAVDPHVHFRDPGHPEKEDFGSGTRAAALGGVTTVLDMPNTSPPVFTREALVDKTARARSKAVVDFGLYAGLDDKGASLSLLSEATALKIYLGATTGDLLVRDMDLVRRALVAAASAGRTVAVHAESQDCLDRHAHLAGDDYPSHAASRPPECEADAIRALAEAARGTGARVHVAHLSTAEGLAAVEGTGFTAEATPHHLLLLASKLREGGPFKMNPPLRRLQDRAALIQALVDGRIQCLGSDHAPHTRAQKAASRMPECPSGVPGVQTMVPLLLADRRVPLARVVEASTAAASVFRLPGKGALLPGHDADLAVYDLARARPVRAEEMASKAGWTPFEGMPAVFPTHVFVRGRAVVEEGAIVGGEGWGRLVAPAGPAPPVARAPTRSSAVAAVGYDAAARTLEIEYLPERHAYVYYGVPPDVHDALLRAPSVGAFVNAYVKPRYGYARRRPDV